MNKYKSQGKYNKQEFMTLSEEPNRKSLQTMVCRTNLACYLFLYSPQSKNKCYIFYCLKKQFLEILYNDMWQLYKIEKQFY